jgi:putative alpha-1,2-mannosidase
VCPGDNTYIIGSPLFDKVTLSLDRHGKKGRTFVMTAKNQSAEGCYIQSATLNRKPLHRSWITHEEIVAGGTLEFVMGTSPNYEWGSGKENLPKTLSFI